jgi:hypothetical protein
MVIVSVKRDTGFRTSTITSHEHDGESRDGAQRRLSGFFSSLLSFAFSQE